MLRHTIFAHVFGKVSRTLPHFNEQFFLKTVSTVHKYRFWEKCSPLPSKIVFTFRAVSLRRMQGESTYPA